MAFAAGAIGGVAGGALFATDASSGNALPALAPAVIEAEEGTVAAVVDAVLPSVVSVEILSGGVVIGTGSGFVISSEGHILTNSHVVEPNPQNVRVVYSDGVQEDATVVGNTSDYDIAILQVDREGLAPLALADSSGVDIGDPVLVIGSPLGLDATVTSGIVSAVHRPIGGTTGVTFIDAIQTDAAINPGNSGGPVLNLRGEVIGVATAIATLPGSTGANAGSVGLGFAIPADQARRTAQEIIDTGSATFPVIGVLLDDSWVGEGVRISDDDAGSGLVAVSPGGPADQAGLQAGDVILRIDGRPVTRTVALIVAIRSRAPGDVVTLGVRSDDGTERDVEVTLTPNTQVVFQDGSE